MKNRPVVIALALFALLPVLAPGQANVTLELLIHQNAPLHAESRTSVTAVI